MKKSIELPEGFKFSVGRKIRIIQKNLIPKNGTAKLCFLGDIHYGARNCDVKSMKETIDHCISKGIYVMTMGDMIDASNRYSVGSGVYEQINPQKQMEEMIEILRPLAEKGLLINIMKGNHENRIQKETGIDISKVMATILGVPYSGSACWNLLNVGGRRYSIYTLHGASGSRYEYTKLKAIIDILHNISADIVAMGHVHALSSASYIRQYIDLRDRTVKEKKIYAILTGSYLKYDDSYAQEKGYPMTKIGSPYITLSSDKEGIQIEE